MRRFLNVALFVLLSGCAYHHFAPGPGMSAADYEPDAARCRLFARGSNPSYSFEAQGSTKFVAAATAGALVGGAIATAINTNANYNDCMEARGWRIADNAQPVATASMAPQPIAASLVSAQSAASDPPPPPAARRNLGIKAVNVTDMLAYSSQIDPPHGVVVMSVMQGGAASVGGLATGDVILSVGGSDLMTIADLQRVLAATARNSAVTAQIWRDHQVFATELHF